MQRKIRTFSRLRTRTIFMLQAFTAFNLCRKSARLASSMKIQSPKSLLPYQAPTFARHFKNVPKHRLKLANLPTPLQDVMLSNSVASLDDSVLQPLRDLNIQLLVKRDDMTAGVELGGNKIRKLEFLLADALDGGYDSVITIGGEQSNHCRATVSSTSSCDLQHSQIISRLKSVFLLRLRRVAWWGLNPISFCERKERTRSQNAKKKKKTPSDTLEIFFSIAWLAQPYTRVHPESMAVSEAKNLLKR